ncbi:MAG: type II toxin-antitoxin system RelE/ParE family toxin [Acidobacteriota bacterium]
MVQVVATDEFVEWFEELGDADAKAVARKVDLLEMVGVDLGHPHSSAIKGSTIALRELRIQSKGKPLRVLTLVPTAVRLWGTYLRETGQVNS